MRKGHIAVYVRAQGSGKWSFRAILAELKGLFLLYVRSTKSSNDYTWYEKCFDVENERYAYLFALKEQMVVSRIEHWHFVSIGPWILSEAICLLLDFLGRNLHGVAHRYLPFHAENADPLREMAMRLLERVSIFWVDGSQDRCLPWSQISEAVAFSVLTVCYPINWFPWRYSDVQDGRYTIYLYDESWQMKKMLLDLAWCDGKRFLELMKIPNYSSTFLRGQDDKAWDICVPGVIREGKNQLKVINYAANAGRALGRPLHMLIVGDPLPAERNYYVRLCKHIRKLEGQVVVRLSRSVSRQKLARMMGDSRMVVAAAQWDGSPRIVQEALCCNTPVLMNSEMLCGSKYIVPGAGLLKPLDKFAEGMIEILSRHEEFRPREFFLAFADPEGTLLSFIKVVGDISKQQKKRLNEQPAKTN
ncbi:MAG: glycosyltransferase [Deltaproteobacteria bacterium]|nr:glycosyltransferase [Deltaproteobacteria bacterium]